MKITGCNDRLSRSRVRTRQLPLPPALMAKPSITAIVLTQDESLHIRRCVESLAPAAERVCVVDSGSTDDTVAIARSLGAEVFTNPWINQAAQFNWALDHCGVRTGWVLKLDADEYLEPDLQVELAQRLGALPSDVHGVLMKRKYLFHRPLGPPRRNAPAVPPSALAYRIGADRTTVDGRTSCPEFR